MKFLSVKIEKLTFTGGTDFSSTAFEEQGFEKAGRFSVALSLVEKGASCVDDFGIVLFVTATLTSANGRRTSASGNVTSGTGSDVTLLEFQRVHDDRGFE